MNSQVIDLWFANKIKLDGTDLTLSIGSEAYEFRAGNEAEAKSWNESFTAVVAEANWPQSWLERVGHSRGSTL